jgi:glucose-6-phosphate dehydrogenase assembly protein OpcA
MNAIPLDSADQTPLRDIEPTLRQMWHDNADDEHPVTQVRTLNLVVFVPAEQHNASLQRAIDELAVRHPGRTITLIAHAQPQPAYAQVSLACRIGEGDKHICGEHITLHGGDNGAPLPSTAAALLLPSLPTFVWWIGDPPFTDATFSSLIELADRVLVDARTWHEPDATASMLAHVVEHTSRFACTDLLWAALTPWRQSIARCFDLPASQHHLRQLEHITITHGSDAHDRLRARLITGWLGSRLGWQVEANGTLRRADGALITLALRQHNQSGLHVVDLRSAGASFSVTQRPQSTCADVEIALPQTTPARWIAPLTQQSLAAYVGEELMLLNRDEGYEAALRFAAQLAVH